MSLISAFVLVWVAVIAAWLILDWLGNPNRGSFRPQSDRVDRTRVPRREKRALRREREDAAVRAVLRDRYGRSSLRLHWSDDEEATAIEADQELLTGSQSAAGLDRLATEPPAAPDHTVELYDGRADEPDLVLDLTDELERSDQPAATNGNEPEPTDEPEPGLTDEPQATDEPEPEPTDEPEPEPTDEPEPEPAVAAAAGWTIGDEPLAMTRSGKPPTSTTVRARVWKNLAAVAADATWDDDNRERMRSGKAPRRRNPLTGRPELAVVDTELGTASWPDTAVDPFGEDDA